MELIPFGGRLSASARWGWVDSFELKGCELVKRRVALGVVPAFHEVEDGHALERGEEALVQDVLVGFADGAAPTPRQLQR